MQTGDPKIIFGADYFPEQWPEEVWHDDIRLMKQANVNMVNLAIFAWALIQPDEDTFTFGWLDKIMDLLAENDIDVCLGTATAAQPNWLTEKYDDILFVRESGEQVAPGSRQTYCVNSPNYRRAAQRLAKEMATHYKGHPALKLWHVNNEYANKNSMCFCSNCETGFREWLKNKYVALDKLNAYWSTVFWSETYSTWEQIHTPRASAGGRNATKLLDYKRFLSESFYMLYMEEVNVLKKTTPDIPITTNFEGDWSKFDHSLFKDDLDVVSWNCYPNPLDPNARKWVALRHSMMRSLLGKPFMLMEQAPSQVDWYPININKSPGLMRLWSYQAIAHGSDSVMYFQWRASQKGAEKYHSGIVPHFGEDSRVYKEISNLGNELSKLQDIHGSTIDAQVAILMDNDSWWSVDNPYGKGNKSLDNETFWAANGQPFPTVLLNYFGELEYYFNAFYNLNVPVDVIPVHYDFSKYKVVAAPLLHMIKPGFKEAVETFVQNGGTFLTTYFTGLIDEHVGVFLNGYLGPLKEVLGVTVEEFDPLPLDGTNRMIMAANPDGFKKEYGCSVWCDVSHVTSAKTLATFGEDYYKDYPCVTESQFGSGRAYYIATRPDADFMHDLITKILKDQKIQLHDLPEGVEIMKRKKAGQEIDFYLNHGKDAIKVELPKGNYENILTQTPCKHVLQLEKYGVAILRRIDENGK
ncbi:beta-galactosidase [candidate division KSB1 bacterium]|nr:beta-galactosidase [candidate division KSB1 bacterium]